jgi:hypothetical protein
VTATLIAAVVAVAVFGFGSSPARGSAAVKGDLRGVSRPGGTTGAAGATGAAGITGATGGSPPEECQYGTAGPSGWVGTTDSPMHDCSETSVDATPATLSEAFRERVVLPRTSLVESSGAPSTSRLGDCVREDICALSISYPEHGLYVSYDKWSDFPTEADAEGNANANLPDGEVLHLDGVPVPVLGNLNVDGFVMLRFNWRDTEIEVGGFENAGALVDIAQSMLDQLSGDSPKPLTAAAGVDLFPMVLPQTQIDPSDASKELGAPVVLPDTATVHPSDATSVREEGQCPGPAGYKMTKAGGDANCVVWVDFPAKSLTIVYKRPAPFGAGEMTDGTRITGARLVDFGGVNALEVQRNAEGQSPGWFQFALDDQLQVTISGDYDTEALRSIAQSIVDRSK